MAALQVAIKRMLKRAPLLLFPVVAWPWSLQAASQDACYKAYQNRDLTAALQQCQGPAEQKDARAAFILATIYYQEGSQAGDQRGIFWDKIAAENGHAEAAYRLALAYQLGQGLEQNNQLAVRWYTQAAQAHHAKAQRSLGAMYEAGYGVTQNLQQAFAWYKRAAAQGLPDAQLRLGTMFFEGRGVIADRLQAQHWIRKSAEAGNHNAQLALGVMLAEIDPQDSVRWYQRSADQGNMSAKQNLALVYFSGQGVGKDLPRALALVDEAIESGNYAARQLRELIVADMPELAVADNTQSETNPPAVTAETLTVAQQEQAPASPDSSAVTVDNTVAEAQAIQTPVTESPVTESSVTATPAAETTELSVADVSEPESELQVVAGNGSSKPIAADQVLKQLLNKQQQPVAEQSVTEQPVSEVAEATGLVVAVAEPDGSPEPQRQETLEPVELIVAEAETSSEITLATVDLAEARLESVQSDSLQSESLQSESINPETAQAEVPVTSEKPVVNEVAVAEVAQLTSEQPPAASAVVAQQDLLPPVLEKESGPYGMEADGWVLQQPAKRYVIQLTNGEYKEGMEKYIRRVGLKEVEGWHFYRTQRDAGLYYVLVYGSYETVAEAKKALQSLPRKARRSHWVRQYATLQKLYRVPGS